MLPYDLTNPEHIRLLLCLLPIMLSSLTIHEYAHARTALAFGDPTAKMLGRLTLNPIRHLDPMGSIVFFLIGGLGWAKPVPVSFQNLHPKALGSFMVSLAGPMSNVGMAIASAIALRYAYKSQVILESAPALVTILWLMARINITLALFNLIPLYPLDGHHMQREILPAWWQVDYMRWQMRYGRIILVVLYVLPMIPGIPFNPLSWLFRNVGDRFVDLITTL